MNKNITLIKLEDTKLMSTNRIKLEIGKRSKFLKEELGMDAEDAANLISSLLNLGSALQERFDEEKMNRENATK